MRKGWHWPVLIVGILGGGIGANVLLLARATGDPSFAVEPDYYAKALAWDAHQAQAGANERLGWSARVEVRPASLATGRARVVIRLTDREGDAVSGALVDFVAFHNARATQIVRASLTETPDHAYETGAPIVRPGLWEFRVEARRGPDTFTAVLQHDAPGPAR